ncbi:unnamed protein product [Adineta ricciae]|uniref:Uncharacterized protein n=1 Tax=Adineta ricciae TaxID=249248 RepID=A0A815LE67_ADIRI|nr:unnamed protein product [Adineta ricciae]CAF1408815.1 unnamed protein product [Adineta ricciae]
MTDETLDYKQELTRALNRLTNYGMVVSAFCSCDSVAVLFAYDLTAGDPMSHRSSPGTFHFYNICGSYCLDKFIGILQVQFCLGRYDSTVYMTEETERAAVVGLMGMTRALIRSSLFGWFFMISLLMAIKNYEAIMYTTIEFPVTQILLDNFGHA